MFFWGAIGPGNENLSPILGQAEFSLLFSGTSRDIFYSCQTRSGTGFISRSKDPGQILERNRRKVCVQFSGPGPALS